MSAIKYYRVKALEYNTFTEAYDTEVKLILCVELCVDGSGKVLSVIGE